jgi:hypothetical protein
MGPLRCLLLSGLVVALGAAEVRAWTVTLPGALGPGQDLLLAVDGAVGKAPYQALVAAPGYSRLAVAVAAEGLRFPDGGLHGRLRFELPSDGVRPAPGTVLDGALRLDIPPHGRGQWHGRLGGQAGEGPAIVTSQAAADELGWLRIHATAEGAVDDPRSLDAGRVHLIIDCERGASRLVELRADPAAGERSFRVLTHDLRLQRGRLGGTLLVERRDGAHAAQQTWQVDGVQAGGRVAAWAAVTQDGSQRRAYLNGRVEGPGAVAPTAAAVAVSLHIATANPMAPDRLQLLLRDGALVAGTASRDWRLWRLAAGSARRDGDRLTGTLLAEPFTGLAASAPAARWPLLLDLQGGAASGAMGEGAGQTVSGRLDRQEALPATWRGVLRAPTPIHDHAPGFMELPIHLDDGRLLASELRDQRGKRLGTCNGGSISSNGDELHLGLTIEIDPAPGREAGVYLLSGVLVRIGQQAEGIIVSAHDLGDRLVPARLAITP